MGVTRASVVKGPGAVIYLYGAPNQIVMYDKDSITSTKETSTEQLPSSLYGKLGHRITDQIGKTTFTPVGLITADRLSALYPAQYTSPVIGSSIFGASDYAVAVHSQAGTLVAWKNSAFTTMPELTLSARKTVFGAAEITHLVRDGFERSSPNALHEDPADVAFSYEGFSESNIKMVPYSGSWDGITGWSSIRAKEGWTITPTLEIEAEQTDDDGTYDYTLKSIEITAKCRPVGVSEDMLFDALPDQSLIGQLAGPSGDLTITGTGGLTVKLKNAVLLQGPLMYGSTELRAGECMWVANPEISELDSTQELFSVALTA